MNKRTFQTLILLGGVCLGGASCAFTIRADEEQIEALRYELRSLRRELRAQRTGEDPQRLEAAEEAARKDKPKG